VTVQILGRSLIVVGLAIAACGALIWVLGALPRLPGDIYVHRRGLTLYIPIVGSILLSLLLTLLLNLFFGRR
jgi:hypothetical protein